MFLRLRYLVGLALPLALGIAAQQPADGLRYAGTVGQQHITLQLALSSDAIRSGHYRYDGQKTDIQIVDSRQFGATVVLQDEDGNILHLHFEDAAGEKTGGFPTAVMLEGTLDRGELDLPVRLKRVDAAAGKP